MAMLQISERLENFQHAPPSEILWWFDAIWNRLLGPWNISAGCAAANYAVHDDLAFTNFVAIVRNQLGFFSYTQSREYRVVGRQYAWLLFISEDRLCTNLRVHKQSMNM